MDVFYSNDAFPKQSGKTTAPEKKNLDDGSSHAFSLDLSSPLQYERDVKKISASQPNQNFQCQFPDDCYDVLASMVPDINDTVKGTYTYVRTYQATNTFDPAKNTPGRAKDDLDQHFLLLQTQQGNETKNNFLNNLPKDFEIRLGVDAFYNHEFSLSRQAGGDLLAEFASNKKYMATPEYVTTMAIKKPETDQVALTQPMPVTLQKPAA